MGKLRILTFRFRDSTIRSIWVWLASAQPLVRPGVDKLVEMAIMIISAALASIRATLAPPVSLKVLLVSSAALPFHAAAVILVSITFMRRLSTDSDLGYSITL